MLRTLLWIVLLVGTPVAQGIEDVVPAGMVLDDAGKLQWSATDAAVCPECEGSRTVACALCARESRGGCALCEEGDTECPRCAGSGAAYDPFEAMVCPLCRGRRRDSCADCRGTTKVVTVSGDEVDCAACDAVGFSSCAFCVGGGRLAGVRVAGSDPRRASLEDLEAVMQRLRSVSATLEQPPEPDSDSASRIESYLGLLAGLEGIVPLPGRQADALRAAYEGAGSDDAAMVVMGHRMALGEYLVVQLRQIELCIWRLRSNADAFATAADTRAASGLQWQSWFGIDPERPAQAHSLLGRGFFRTRSAENTDEVVAGWLEAHPEATVRVVSRLRGFLRNAQDSEFCYVWIEDGAERLNLHLVEQGCVAAGTMGSPVPTIEVPLAEYAAFLHALEAAETAAKEARRGVWGDAESDREDLKAAAERALESGRHAEALEKLETLVKAGGADAYVWLDIGKCRERLGRWEAALEAYDKAIGDGRWWPPYTERARCLANWKGLDAAVEWLEGLAAATPDDHKYPRILGGLLMEEGEIEAAIEQFLEVVRIVTARHGFRFDAEGWLIVDEDVLAKENNDFADYWPTLEDLATCLYELDDTERALRHATMGVAIGQQLNRCKGYYDDVEIEAGDVDCRLVRARLFLQERRLDDAEKEIRLAGVLADRSSYSPAKRAVERARAELERARKR